nr:class II SORL domain-containing protein [Myxococcota bacterium]
REEWSATGAPTGRVPADASALDADERMHVPVLTLPERVRAGRAFDLVVQVGVRPHEMTADHRIEWVEVCLDERRVWVADLSADVAYPIVRVPIVLREGAVLSARARCSQHGVWMTRRSLVVA